MKSKLRALIEKDGQTTAIVIDLLDNGKGADLVANDGLYSRYFAGFDNKGRYILRLVCSIACLHEPRCKLPSVLGAK